MHSACPEESFEHFSLEKRWFLNDLRTLSEKNPDFAELLRQISETSIYVSGEKFWEKKTLKKRWFFGNFVPRVKKLDFGQNSLARVVKDAFGVSRGIFWAFFIEKTMISEWNSYFERKSSGLCQNFTADFRNSNLRVRRKFVREKKIEKTKITK